MREFNEAVQSPAGVQSSGEVAVQELILAVRSENSDSPDDEVKILYTVGLVTTENRYPTDIEVFEQIARAWSSKPLGR